MEGKVGATKEEESKLNFAKSQVLQIMDEVLLDAVETLLKNSEECKELLKQGPAKMAEQIEDVSEKLHTTLLELEHDVCLLRGIDIEKYYEDVTYYDNNADTEVKQRLDQLARLIETALKGEKITVSFEIVPELTKPATINLYKLILISHLHLHHASIQKYLKDHPKATVDDLQTVVDNDETMKVKRR